MLERDHNSQQHDDRHGVASTRLHWHAATSTAVCLHWHHMLSVKFAVTKYYTVIASLCIRFPLLNTNHAQRVKTNLILLFLLEQWTRDHQFIHPVSCVCPYSRRIKPLKWFQWGMSHCCAAHFITVANCVCPLLIIKANWIPIYHFHEGWSWRHLNTHTHIFDLQYFSSFWFHYKSKKLKFIFAQKLVFM